MTHREPSDEVREQAALYALGGLDPQEAATFEAHLAEGCRTCEVEVTGFAVVTGRLGHAGSPARPRPEVRDRLFTRLRAEAARADWTIVRSAEGEWESAGTGMSVKRLFRDQAGERMTTVVRMEGGTHYPRHRHAGFEELYLLDGDLTVEGQVLRAGDYCAAPAGTHHGVTHTDGGCTFVLHASEHDQILEEAPTGPPPRGLVFVRASEGAWKTDADAGVMRLTIFVDPARDTVTRLVRMQPGASLRGRRPVTAEQLYMLEGDAHVTGGVLQVGDYYCGAARPEHPVTHTEGGCLFLMISSKAEVAD